jgi:hypothetical protein
MFWHSLRAVMEEQRQHNKEDMVLYAMLVTIIARFITFDRLQEVSHGKDTQVNESFNNVASWLAPKNKKYCRTGSLSNRISIGIGITSIGLLQYFERLYHELGITVTPNVLHFINFKEKRRAKRLLSLQTNLYKKERMKRKYLQLAEDEKTARKERSKRDGTYTSGMNMAAGGADGYTLEELLQAATAKPKKQRVATVCPHCKLKGHSTTRSSKCLYHKSKPAPVPETDPSSLLQVLQDRAEDIDDHAAFALQEDTTPSDDDEFAEFFDAGTWDSDAEEAEETEGMNNVM